MPPAAVRQTVLWAAVTVSAFAAVLAISMLPSRGAERSAAPAAPPEPDTAASGGPASGEPSPGAANPWAQFSAPRQFLLKVEDGADLHGRMLLATGPDNEGVRDNAGLQATVRYVWCADDGGEEEEKDGEEVVGQSGSHWAEFDLDVPAAGTYYPWARVWWEDSCGNSIVVAWRRGDGPIRQFVVQDGTLESWHWLPVAGVEGVKLERGPYRLVVRNREDGARLSRIFFSSKPYDAYKPETPEG